MRPTDPLPPPDAMYRAIAANLPGAAVFVVGHDLRYRLAEGDALRAAGFTPADLEGRHLRDVLPPPLYAEYTPYYRKALAGEPFEVEHAAHGREYVTRGTPLRDPAGAVSAALVVSYDITDRKRAEAELRASEERQAFLLALSDALRPLADPVAIQEVACRLVGEYLGAARVGYAEDRGDGATVAVTRNYTAGVPDLCGTYLYDDYGPELLREFRAGRTVARGDIPNDPSLSPAEKDAHAALRLGATVNVPLVKGGRLVAILFAHFAAPHPWPAAEVGLIQETAERTWAAVERAKAEAALRAAHDTFRHLVEHSPFGVYAVDADFRLARVSAGAQKVFATIRPLLGRDFAEVLRILWPEPFATEAIGHLRHTLATGEAYRAPGTVERRHDIGEVEAYDWKIERVTLPDGRFGVVCHFYDLSERQRYEAALRAGEERQAYLVRLGDALRPLADPFAVQEVACRLLGEHLRVDRAYFVEIDDRGGVARVRSDYLRGDSPSLVGEHRVADFGWVIPPLRRGEVLVIPDADRCDLIPPADRPAMAAVRIAAHVNVPLVKGGELVGAVCVTEPRPRAWAAAEVVLVRETAERIWAAVERAKAEAALRASEARHRRLFYSNLIGVIAVLEDGRILDSNDAFLRMLGYDRADLAAGRMNWRALTPPDELAAELEAAKTRLTPDGEVHPYEKVYLHKDGRRVSVLLGGAFVEGTRGEGICFVLDITDRKRAEDALRAARDELELRVRERTAELAGAVAALEDQFAQRRELARRLATAEEAERRRVSRELHDEMGQHLAALILGLAAVEGKPGEADRLRDLRGLADRIGREVHRVAVELRPTALDDLGLYPALRNYADEWGRQTGVRVDVHIPGDGPRLPPEHETTAYRIAQEALTNVRRHAAATRVGLVVERRPAHLLVIVEDDGRGYDPDAPPDPRRLGVAGMRERAELLGGTVEVESAPGAGTTVFARLPLAPP